MHRRNPKISVVELRGYKRCVESLWRVLCHERIADKKKLKNKYPKPCEQMQYTGQYVQIDVKVVPSYCIGDPQLKLY